MSLLHRQGASKPTRSAQPRKDTKSISNMLTLSLVLTIGTISIAMIAAMYLYRVETAKKALNKQADELLVYLVGIVERPLWDMNEKDVATIGEVIARNELVNNVVIRDSYGKTIYTFERAPRPHLINRSGRVVHDEKFAGEVFLALNRKTYDESSGDVLLSSLMIVSVTAIILVVATGFLVRRFLKAPLNSLNNIVAAYAAGIYDFEPKRVPYEEFQPFGRVLREMGIKITQHIHEVKQAQENYRSIFENAVEGIFQSTIDGGYLSVSPSMAHMTGYESPEKMIEGVTDIRTQCYVNPEDRDMFVRILVEKDTVKGLEVEMMRRDGRGFWVSLSGRLIRDGQGRPRYIEGFAIDITNRKNLETQLRRAHKMEAIGTLAGGIAHDFKNILGVIIGCSELALANASDAGKSQIYLNKVLKAGKRASSLVNQILTFSRQGEAEIKPIYIGRIVKETLKFIRATLPATIEIRENVDPESGPALADPTQVHQVLMNLCTNAAQAMQEKGGTLEVGLARGEHPPPHGTDSHAGAAPQAFVELRVRDSGQGMTPETLERIFDPFYTTKPVGEGTGLGLSVVHGIVKKHNGFITVESEPGKGSLFRVHFPEADSAQIGREENKGVSVTKGAGRILVVDDERLLAETMADMLEELGYTATATHQSHHALEIFKADPSAFDAVITDLTMPCMTGFDLVREIIRIEPNIPVILCTGFSELIQPEQARAAGVHDILLKPVVRAQLSSAVHKALERK